MEYGSGVPLEITCVLDPKNKVVQKMIQSSVGVEQPSQNIVFNKDVVPIPEKYVTIINSTAAQIRFANLPVSVENYYCGLIIDLQKINNHSLDTTTVASESSTLKKNLFVPPTDEDLILVYVCGNKVSVGCKFFFITDYNFYRSLLKLYEIKKCVGSKIE